MSPDRYNIDNPRKEIALASLLDEIANTLNYMAGAGCKGFDSTQTQHHILERWDLHQETDKESLDDIMAELVDCKRCELSKKRSNIVFGDGNPKARLVFVGEGPGFEEDKQGKPFVGAAGELLTKIIKAMNLSRSDVYICNIVKCRPPNNRNPKEQEILTCTPFLERQLKAIQPDFICALGKFAAQTLLRTETPISRLRGRFHDYRGIRLMPTYHPAYLLRNPERKRDVWEDMQQLMTCLGLC